MSTEIVSLGQVTSSVMGQAPPSEYCNTDGVGTPFVKAGEFGKVRPVIREWTKKPLKLAKHSDVLLCVVGATCGKINRGADCAIGRSVAAIRCDESRLDNEYLYHFLGTWTKRLRQRSQGAAQTVITREMISAIELPLPSLAEQHRIATILDKADALRAKRREAMAKLDQLLQSMFLDMFGPHVSDAKGWPTVTLGQALSGAEVFTDGDWVESKDQDPNGDVRLVQLADVGDGSFIDKSRRFLTHEKALALRCTFLQQGDLLVARMPDPLGRACVFPGDVRRAVTVVDVCVIRPNQNGPNRRWLCACLNSDSVRNQIARMATGTTRSRISRGNLSKVELVMPPLDIQERFDRFAELIEKAKGKLRCSADQLDTLFANLQHRAFTGTL